MLQVRIDTPDWDRYSRLGPVPQTRINTIDQDRSCRPDSVLAASMSLSGRPRALLSARGEWPLLSAPVTLGSSRGPGVPLPRWEGRWPVRAGSLRALLPGCPPPRGKRLCVCPHDTPFRLDGQGPVLRACGQTPEPWGVAWRPRGHQPPPCRSSPEAGRALCLRPAPPLRCQT